MPPSALTANTPPLPYDAEISESISSSEPPTRFTPPAPALPADVIAQTFAKYQEALQRLTT